MDWRLKRRACSADCLVIGPIILNLFLLANESILGSKGSKMGQQNAPQPFRLHSGAESAQRAKERQPPFGPFPRSKIAI